MFKLRFTTFLLFTLLFVSKITAQVTADFEADTTSGCGSASIQFTDLSSGNITSWNWSFGNSNTSTLQNPSANYTIVGNYDVTLTVSDGNTTDSKTISNYIQVFRTPTADFTLNPTTGCSPLPVSFTDNSTVGSGAIQTYFWDFSDGSQPSSAKDPTHIYLNGGTYPPSLQVTDVSGCSDLKVFNNIVVTAAPIADFSSSTATTCTDTLTVHFNNTSLGGNLSYKWYFGDGDSSFLTNPAHFYDSLANYDVTLIASDPNCSDTLVLTNYVRLESTNAQFSIQKDSFCFGESINFNNQSTGANLFRWDFGDGTNSSQENPTKIYQDSGFFEVRLTVSAGSICLKTFSDTIYVQQVIADFTVTPEFSCHRTDTVIFRNTSTNADSAFWRIENYSLNPILKYSDSIYTSLPPDTVAHEQSYYYDNEPSYYADTLVVYSNLGCTDTLIKDTSRTVEVLNTSIVYDPQVKTYSIPGFSKPVVGGCAPIEIQFTDTTTGPGPIISWEWSIQNPDTTNNIANTRVPPKQAFVDDTLRIVNLKITNNLGCSAISIQPVAPGFKQNPSFILEPDSLCPSEDNFIYDTSSDSNKINSSLFNFYKPFKNQTQFEVLSDTIQDYSTGSLVIRRGKRIGSFFPDTGTYNIVHIITDNGCDTIDSTSVKLFVHGPISLTNASNTNNCVDRRVVQFNGNFIGVTRFVWDFGDSSLLDSTNENPLHTYPDFKKYYPSLAIFNDDNRCDPIYDTTIIDLSPPPPFEILPNQKIYCENSSIIYLNSTATRRYLEFNWIINGDTISRKEDYLLDTVPGTYYVELAAKDNLGCTYTELDTFFISNLEANFDTTLVSKCFPIDVEFKEKSITDTSIIRWEWRFGNGDASIQQTDTTSYNTAGFKTVFLEVENAFNCIDSVEKKDFLNFDLLEVNFLNDLTTSCLGDTITFRNVSSGLNPQYNWDFGDGTILTDTSAEFLKHVYAQSGVYTVTLTAIDETGCLRSEVKTDLISVDNIIPGFTADTIEADCYPFPVNFQDTSSGNISTWEWRFGDGASSVFENPFHNYTSVGEFDVFLKGTTPSGCTDSIEKVAYIKTKGPEAEFVFDKDTICINEEVTFNITQSNNVASFFWDFGDGNGGQGNPVSHTYTQKTGDIVVALIVSDASGNCTVPLEDNLYVYEVKADFTVSADKACVPYEANFTNTSIGDDSFRWVFAPGVFSTEQNPSYNFPQAGKFPISLEISSNIGCKDTATKELEVFPIPMAQVSSDTGFCEGDSVLLIGSGGTSYRWTPINALSDPFNDTTFASPDSTTNYQLLVSNVGGCEDSNSVEVFVQHPIDYNAIPDSTIIIGETINLNAYAGLGFNYKWTPETGLSCANCANPIAKPLVNQTYILEIFDDFDCFYLKDTIEIEVIEKYSLDVPTAFSPNGDGSNDIIYAKGWGLKELIAFKIYNRFGELVFESTDFDKGWDGTYRGQPQNVETYVFTVEALTYSGKVLTKKGNISLLR